MLLCDDILALDFELRPIFGDKANFSITRNFKIYKIIIKNIILFKSFRCVLENECIKCISVGLLKQKKKEKKKRYNISFI